MRFGERMRLVVEVFGVASSAPSSFCRVSLDLAHINDRENAIANTPRACTRKMRDHWGHRSPGIVPQGRGDTVGRVLGVGSDLGLGVGLTVTVGEGPGVTVPVAVAVGDGVGVTVPVAVVVAVGIGRGGRVGRGEYVGSGRGVAVGKGVAVPIGETRT
jgi:hypothetical protein